MNTKFACIILFVLLLSACENELSQNRKETIITNIDRIFKHEPTSFSFHTKKDLASKEATATELFKVSDPRNVHMIYDIPCDKLMWAKYVSMTAGNILTAHDASTLEIHVHSPDDFYGGGWDHGKFGKGQTEVIQ